jgi:hypothetical protein
LVSRSLYPTQPWPLARLTQHPCLPFLIREGNDPETKPSRARELQALLAVINHVHEHVAAYAEPRPVSKVFDAVPAMPLRYDASALLDELVRMKLFVIEMRDFVAMLVPAESASAKPAKTELVTLSTKVPADVADQVLEAANQRGLSRSALIASLIAQHLANV